MANNLPNDRRRAREPASDRGVNQRVLQRSSSKADLYDASYFERIDKASRRPRYVAELKRAAEMLRVGRGSRVLDLGCSVGNGRDLVTRETGATVVGVDMAPAALEFWEGPGFVLADGHTLPFRDQCFDAAFLTHVVGHVVSPEIVLLEVMRVLRPGGRLGIVTPNRWFVWAMRPLNWCGVIPYAPDPTVLRFFRAGSIAETLRRSGFALRSLETYGALPVWLDWLSGSPFERFMRERLIAVGMASEAGRKFYARRAR